MNVIRQILENICNSTERDVLIESLSPERDLHFYLSLLSDEGYVKQWSKPRLPHHDTQTGTPTLVTMTWKGYDLYDQLHNQNLSYLRSQGL